MSDTMFAFIQVLKPVIKYLHTHGFKVISNIDDFIKFVMGLQAARQLFLLVTLHKCGWLITWQNYLISQIPRALGFLVDTQKMMFFIPKQKMDDFFIKIRPFFKALGSIVRLKTRALYSCIHESDFGWYQRIVISAREKLELQFWMDNLARLDDFPLENKLFLLPILRLDMLQGLGWALVSGNQGTEIFYSGTIS